jgi:pimeloyl-ACP methyl ester carboxylesterase
MTPMKTGSIALLAACVCLTVLIQAGASSAGTPQTCPDNSHPKCTIQLSTGITMRYLQVGPSNGPAVFLLHGYTDTSRSLAPVMSALHRLLPGLDIIDPDLRGHGQSSLPAGAGCPAAPDTCFRPSDFARDIVAFMDARHIRHATMVGHSMGTLVAQELGLSYPQRVGKLVLISTATDGQSEPAVSDLLGLVDGFWEPAFLAAGYSWPDGVYDVSPAVAAPGFEDFLTGFWDADAIADPAFLAQTVTETAATPLGTWIGALQAITETDNTQRLEQLKPPTLVLWAVQDDIFSRAIEQKLIDTLTIAAHNGGSFWWKQYGVLPPPADGTQTDLGHNLVWEAPGAIALDIASYLTLGRPTNVLFHTAYPADIHRIVSEPGKATLIHQP